MSKNTPTLEEWTKRHKLSSFQDQVSCHVSQYLQEDVAELTRLVMISLRQEIESAPIVYGEKDLTVSPSGLWGNTKEDEDDIQARLMCIEPVENDEGFRRSLEKAAKCL